MENAKPKCPGSRFKARSLKKSPGLGEGQREVAAQIRKLSLNPIPFFEVLLGFFFNNAVHPRVGINFLTGLRYVMYTNDDLLITQFTNPTLDISLFKTSTQQGTEDFSFGV